MDYFSVTFDHLNRWAVFWWRFGQAKFAYGGSDFKLEPIFATASAASKNGARFKSGQSWLENNRLGT